MKELIILLITFFKIGAFSFGGGYAMLPLIEEEVVFNHGWLTSSEFVDILAIAEMTPGPIAINSATFLGYRVGGIFGAFFATIGVVLPSFIAMSLIIHFILKFKQSPYVEWIFRGIRPVVLGFIAAAAISVGRTSLIGYKSIAIAAIVFVLVSFKKIHPIIAIGVAAALGLVLF